MTDCVCKGINYPTTVCSFPSYVTTSHCDVSVVLFAAITRKCRILDVVYNASNNELVRTKTLVKNCIVQVDCIPFRQW